MRYKRCVGCWTHRHAMDQTIERAINWQKRKSGQDTNIRDKTRKQTGDMKTILCEVGSDVSHRLCLPVWTVLTTKATQLSCKWCELERGALD